MSILIGLLTFVLVLDCFVLILLVLMQLPKKEAGAGLAFGAGTTDALFGAGTGNALTQATKYAAGIFLGLSLILSVLNARYSRHNTSVIDQELSKPGAAAVLPPSTNLLQTAPATNAGGLLTTPPANPAPAPTGN